LVVRRFAGFTRLVFAGSPNVFALQMRIDVEVCGDDGSRHWSETRWPTRSFVGKAAVATRSISGPHRSASKFMPAKRQSNPSPFEASKAAFGNVRKTSTPVISGRRIFELGDDIARAFSRFFIVSRSWRCQTPEKRLINVSWLRQPAPLRDASRTHVRAGCQPASQPLRIQRAPLRNGRACGGDRLERSAASDSLRAPACAQCGRRSPAPMQILRQCQRRPGG
jgi:hypothetical protein